MVSDQTLLFNPQLAVHVAPCHSKATKRTRLCRKINEPTRVDLLNLHLLEAPRWGRRHVRFWATSSLPLPYGRGAESGRVGRAEQALRPLQAVVGVVLTSRRCGNVLAFCPSVTKRRGNLGRSVEKALVWCEFLVCWYRRHRHWHYWKPTLKIVKAFWQGGHFLRRAVVVGREPVVVVGGRWCYSSCDITAKAASFFSKLGCVLFLSNRLRYLKSDCTNADERKPWVLSERRITTPSAGTSGSFFLFSAKTYLPGGYPRNSKRQFWSAMLAPLN